MQVVGFSREADYEAIALDAADFEQNIGGRFEGDRKSGVALLDFAGRRSDGTEIGNRRGHDDDCGVGEGIHYGVAHFFGGGHPHDITTGGRFERYRPAERFPSFGRTRGRGGQHPRWP